MKDFFKGFKEDYNSWYLIFVSAIYFSCSLFKLVEPDKNMDTAISSIFFYLLLSIKFK